MNSGTTAGPYTISGGLGAGGMGQVFRARDNRLNRDVALKVLPREFVLDADRLHRFEQESRTLAALNHPNVLTIYDAGVHEGSPYLVSELLEGRTLRDELSAAQLPGRKIVDYALQIARGLAAAHDKQIIHRDLKPENIFITKDGRAKILDFGLAKLLETTLIPAGANNRLTSTDTPTVVQTSTHNPTEPGRVMGTPSYMAPEQVRGEAVDHRADVFAFGCVLYEMLSGERPFRRDTSIATMAAIMSDEPPELVAMKPEVSPALARIVHRCLEKDPGRRFQSAHDLAFGLENLSGSNSSLSAAAPRAPINRLVSKWALALGGLVAGVLLAAFWPRAVSTQAERPGLVPHLSIALPAGVSVLSDSKPLIAISPDGTRIVYAGRGTNGVTRLWEQRLDQPVPRPIPATEGAQMPFFSPDGSWVAYADEIGQTMMKVSLAGGAPVVVCDKAPGHGGTWAADGHIYFAPGWSEGIWKVNPEGDAKPALLVPADPSKGERAVIWPSVVGGADALLYTVWTGGSFDAAKVVAYSLKTGQHKEVFKGAQAAQYAKPGRIIFAREGSLYEMPFDPHRMERKGPEELLVQGALMGPVEGDAQFSVSSLGSIVYIPGGIIMCPREGVWVDRKGKARPIAESLPVAGNLQLSPDGKAVALGLGSAAKVDVYTFDLERGIATKVSGSGDDYQALWTHDSRKLVYISGRLGGQTLFSRNADGTGPEEPLTTNEGTKRPTSTLGDGTIAFSWRTTGPWGVWTLSPQSKPAKPTPLLTNSWNQVDAVFSPDGKWLAYSSDESGKMEVYVQSYPEGTSKLRVSGEGGSVPRWSRDGRELFYTTQSKLMAVQSVNTERFQPGKPGMLFEAQNYVLYDVSLDGKEFLMMRLDESTAVTRFNWLPVSRAVQLSQR